jgi:hypothetical protein
VLLLNKCLLLLLVLFASLSIRSGNFWIHPVRVCVCVCMCVRSYIRVHASVGESGDCCSGLIDHSQGMRLNYKTVTSDLLT